MKTPPKKIEFSSSEVKTYISDKEFINLMTEAEAFCDRELTHREINSLIYIRYQLGLSFDVCEFLLEYCASVNKMSFTYIEKIACNWYEAEISTRKEATKYIYARNNIYTEIFTALGFTSRTIPAPVEKAYINKWTGQYGFSKEIIIEACNRAALQNPSKATFPYVNGILTLWHQKGIKTKDELKHFEEQKYSQKGHLIINDQFKTEEFNKLYTAKPCPFCGESASLYANYSEKFEAYFVAVKCIKCGSQGKTFVSNEHPEKDNWNNEICQSAVNAWNNRAI